MTKSNLGEERAYVTLEVKVHHREKLGQELKQDSWRSATYWPIHLAHSQVLAKLSYIAQSHFPREWYHPQWVRSAYFN